MKFYSDNNFGGNKKNNFCKNILDKSRFLLKNRVDNLLTTFFEIDFSLSEEIGQKGGNIISETMMKEINKIKINDLFRKFYEEQIKERLQGKTLEEKIKQLKFLGLSNIIYHYGATENYTLQHIFNFKNKYILSFLFNLILNHHGTVLTGENDFKIKVKGGSFKEKTIPGKNCNGNSIAMVGHDIDGNRWILYFCTNDKLNRLEYNKSDNDEGGVKKYMGGIESEPGLVHLIFKKIVFGDLNDIKYKGKPKNVKTSKIIIMNDKLLDKKKLKARSKEDGIHVETLRESETSTKTEGPEGNIYDDSFHKAHAFDKSTNMSYLLLKPKNINKSEAASGPEIVTQLPLEDYELYAEPSGNGWSYIKSLKEGFRKNLVLLKDYDEARRHDSLLAQRVQDSLEEELGKILNNDLNDDIKIKKLQDLLIMFLTPPQLEENRVFKQHNEKGTMESISNSERGSGFQSKIIEFAKAWVREYPEFKNSVLEDVHGDNNCFYRAYLNGFLYLLLNKKGEEKIRNIKQELNYKCEGKIVVEQKMQNGECELIKKLLRNIEGINEWFKERDISSPHSTRENYPGYHNVSLLMIYFLKYIMSYSFKRILLEEHEDLFRNYDEGEDGFKEYWDNMLDNRNDNYENYSKYGSNVWGDEQLLPLFKYFGINTYIIDISNMDDEINWGLNFQGKNKWEYQYKREEAIFLIKNGGHYKVLYPVDEEIKK